MVQIKRPQLNSATALTALEMNNILFDKKHTVLTPQLLEQISKKPK